MIFHVCISLKIGPSLEISLPQFCIQHIYSFFNMPETLLSQPYKFTIHNYNLLNYEPSSQN